MFPKSDMSDDKAKVKPETKVREGPKAEYRTNDTAPWPVSGVYKPDPNDPLAKSVNEMQVEFKDNKVTQGDKLPGRVFLDLKEPTKLDDVTIDLNRTMLDGYGSLNKQILPHKPTDKNKTQGTEPQPNKFRVVPIVDTPSKVPLPAGTHEISFEVEVPKDAIPSFYYVSPKDGASVHNTYSTEGVARLNGKPARTDRVPTDVKSLGDTRQGLGQDFGDDVVAIPKKYITKDSGIDYVLGQKKDSKQPKFDTVPNRVVQTIDVPPVGIHDENILRPTLTPKKLGSPLLS
ncbi:unnamed protein product [Dibothriocephalus latus]|uniref:Arrestin-like N-terminal domain-containing protein n=1 Tax=Dibothriocephalus latus TaxID=60516 RepID=A0A3P6T3L8_DIBLA|nr:unnamed protein product [Dibothriocephalus latus]